MSTSKKEWDELAAELAARPPWDAETTEATWRELAAGALETRDLYGLGVCLINSAGVVHLVAEILRGNSADWKPPELKRKHGGRPRKSSAVVRHGRAVVEAGEDTKLESRVKDVTDKTGVSRRTIFKELKPARALDRAVKEKAARDKCK